jgi:hypothetical protein
MVIPKTFERKKIAVGRTVLESTGAFAVCIKLPRGCNTCRISPGPPIINPKKLSVALRLRYHGQPLWQ